MVQWLGWGASKPPARHPGLRLLAASAADGGQGAGLQLLAAAGAERSDRRTSSASETSPRGQWRWVPRWGSWGEEAPADPAAAQRRYFATVQLTAGLAVASTAFVTEPTGFEAGVAAAVSIAAVTAVATEVAYYTSGVFAGLAPWMAPLLLDCGKHRMEWSQRSSAIHAGVAVYNDRLQPFYRKCLDPYKYPQDTKTSMSLRVADSALTVANAVSPFFRSWQAAITILRYASKLTTITPYMIGYVTLSNDVGEALADLAALMNCEQLSDCQISTKDLAVGLYYLLIYRRGERGNNPLIMMSEHLASSPGVVDPEAPNDLLDILSKYAPLAKFVYQEPEAEVQRLCRLQGYRLLHYEQLVPIRHPPFAVLVHEAKREAEVVIRGTKHVSDVLVDMCATPDTLHANGTSYEVHRGMLRSALWVLCKVYFVLRSLAEKGYRIGVVGHSLGAGIGLMLTAILRDSFLPDLQCVAFATPSCGDKAFAEYCEGFAVSCVNADDIVPRVRPGSLRNLLVAVSDPILQDHSQRDLSGDTAGFLSRLCTAWAPKLRDGTQEPPPAAADGVTPSPLPHVHALTSFVAAGDLAHEHGCDGAAAAEAGDAEAKPHCAHVAALGRVLAADTATVQMLSCDGVSMVFEFKRGARLSLLRCFAAERCGLESARRARLYVHSPPQQPVLLHADAWNLTLNEYFDTCPTHHMPPLIVYVFSQAAEAEAEAEAEATHAAEPPAKRRKCSDASIGSDASGPGGGTPGVLALTFCNPAEPPEFVGLLEVDFATCSVKEVAAAIACAARRTDFRAIEVFRASPLSPGDAIHSADTPVPVGDGDVWKMKLVAVGLASGDVMMGRDAWGARLAGRATAPRPNTDYAEFWPPGRVVHMYRCCGHTRAAVLRPWARALERIELSSNIADDHRMDSIMRSLRSLRATRAARAPEIKAWEPFFAAERCRSCRAEFSWCSTGTSAAAALRSQCHCHHCGRVVCSECRQKTLPTVLSLHPVPICDTCFFTLPSA